jgi:hypothetical protein
MLLSDTSGGTQVVNLGDFWLRKLGRICVPREPMGIWVLEGPRILMMLCSLSWLGWLPLVVIARV